MTTAAHSAKMQELIRRLDDACSVRDDEGRCKRVKDVLVDIVGSGEDFIDPPFLAPAADRYARRLMHRDPADRYTVLAMVWGPRQATPLHDHAGIWCVECVYRGKIEVTSYSVRGGDPEEGVVLFEKAKVVTAGIGEAGALIPPFEYHTIANVTDTPSVTIHVYGGEMTHCHIFQPVEGGYRREFRELAYTA
jgi:predicted metal-dependent enzyme (double-stranded beta helix superfamily)